MFLNDSKIGFRFGREPSPDADASALRTASTQTASPQQANTPSANTPPSGTAAGRTPPPMRLTPAPLDGADGQATAPQTAFPQTTARAGTRPDEAGAGDGALDEPPLVLTRPAPERETPALDPAADRTGDRTGDKAGDRPAGGVATAQPLIAQVRAAITQAPSEDEARLLDSVLRTIEELSARQSRQDQEVAEARDSVARMAADKARLVEEKARLAEENQQMRDLLSALLRTVEQERRRRTEALSRINARLHDMTGAAGAKSGGTAERAA
ncbi:hypothetical protein [Oleisolibacter albus]|uniref:hypothetical protein n=1 Tax=Oleisolibacter albus TaxID=2171757 RepID=UPI000DF1BCC9|nr:hypothetical protein [Oleisolibacter albus]